MDDAEAAFFNAGSIRIDDVLAPGPITQYDVIRVLPFGGAVVEVENAERGEVRLGGGATACTFWLPPIIAGFRERHPGITVRLSELYTTDDNAVAAFAAIFPSACRGAKSPRVWAPGSLSMRNRAMC